MIRPESFRTIVPPAAFRVSPATVSVAARSAAPAANGTFSTYLASNLLNHAFVATLSYVPPATIYAALYTAAPTPGGGGTEVSGDPNYTRRPITFAGHSGFPPATLENTVEVVWPVATIDWGALAAVGLLDASTGGNLLAFGLMLLPDGVTVAPKMVQAGDVFLITVGAFVIGLA
jgi:hypothetical protein